MKCFKCTVLDKEWKTCTGFVEAVSPEEAKKQIKSLGYSVVSVLEYAGSDVRQLNVFHSEGEETVPAPLDENTPPSARQVIHPLKFLAPMGLLIAAAGAAFIVYFYFLAKPAAGPDDAASAYLHHGVSADWQAQYPLLSQRLQNFYGSPENYQVAMQNDWFGITAAVQPEEGTAVALVQSFAVTKQTDTEAVLRTELPAEGGRSVFEFLTVFEGGKWKIDSVRNLARMQQKLNFLAAKSSGEQPEKVLFELQEEYGLSPDELDMLLNRARIDFMQRERQEAIDRQAILARRRERDLQQGIVQSSIEDYEEDTAEAPPETVFPEGDGGEDDQVQAKLEAVLAIVEDSGN